MSANSVESGYFLDIKEISKILPHRYPFLLVDRIIEVDLEKNYLLGQKNVTCNEHFFEGHFPDAPIMPGVLIIEAMAQAGGILVHLKGHVNKIAVLMNIIHAKFRSPIRPGDVIYLKIDGQHISSKGGRIKGEAIVNNKVAAEAEISFALINKNQI